tara:strand:+ start:316 stop:1329 length:1014 start_codon:yes stop_codon:yes gene_type:complete
MYAFITFVTLISNLMKQLFVFVCLGLIFLSSCVDDSHSEVKAVSPRIEIGHFDHDFFGMDSVNFDDDLLMLMKQYPDFFKIGMNHAMLKSRFFDTEIRELYMAVDSTFSNTKELDAEIHRAFQYYYHHFENHDSLKIYTWVSNFERLDPILVSQNTLLISLDMYLGSDSHFYKTAPDYIKQRFDKMYILSDLFRSYFSSNIPLSDNHTLLASMLYYGKIHYLISLMLPNYDSHVIMGYTKDKMQWCLRNESNIWAYFVENKLLFSSNQQNKMRFIDDAPFSKFYTSFDRESPGRIGQWIGMKIVQAYMNSHPDLTLTDLIRETDAQKILRESRYKPK